MFGQSNNPNTPFGGGGFGQPSTNTPPVFGSPNPGQPQPGGLFSSPPPVFGQQQQQQQQQPVTNAFGAPTTSAFGGGGFGAPAPAPTGFGSTGAFGAPAPAPTGFGGGAFGAPSAPTNTFGSTTGGGGLFGSSAPVGGGFGQPAPTGGGLFGQTPAPAFGAAPTSTFGAPATTSTFGAPSTGLFGAAPAPTTTFGAPSPTAFGAPAAFGAPTPSVFGAPAPSTGFFGSTPAPAPFGAPAPIGGLFGSPPAPATTGFGGTTSLFGSTPAPTFGSPSAPTTNFGASGGLFSSTASVSSTGSGGTRIAPYQVTSRQDGTANINLQSISAMDAYKDQSHEELRFADYSQGNRGTASPAPATFGGFGAPAPAPIGGGLFGSSTPAPTSTFGSTSGGLFGSTPAPSFGAAPAPLGGFGQSTGGSLFGQAPAPSTAFGAPTPAFGSPAPAPSGLFGAPAPTGLFGSAPAPAPFGAPAPSGLFGSTPAPSTGFGGGLFGSTPAPSTFGAPASGGLFGAPAPAVGGLFGAPAPAAPFGQPSSFGAPTPSLFGAAPAPAFGSPAPAGYFGQPTQQQQFQQPMQPFQIQTVFNAPIVAPGVSEVLEQQIRALTNQLDENKKLEVWRGPKAPTSPATTPTNNHNNTASFFSRNVNTDGYKTPSSRAQIRPRSFAQSEQSKAVVSTLSTGRDNSALMSPEVFARSSQLNLVVRPDSLRRLNKLSLPRSNQETTAPVNIPEQSIDPVPTEPTVDTLPITNGEEPKTNQIVNAQDSVKTKALQPIEPPTRSPGYEYYQHVIGTSHQSINQPITPVTNGTANGTHRQVPKLTKSGYEVSPTVEEMACMSEADLASVRNFAVSRPGYGKVEWEGSVDVRGANLDEIVVIEPKDVSVYNLDEEKGTKPDEGTKLNRPALITFEGIFPKEGAYADDELKSRFTLKLKKAVSNMNAEFVEYDSTNGIWKIRVRHFSRYALIDDDDSDQEVSHNELIDELVVTPRPTKFEKEKRKATPYASSRMAMESMTINDEDFSNNEITMIDSEPFVADIEQRAENAATAIRAKLQKSPLLRIPDAGTGMDVDDDLNEEQIDDNETNDPLLEQFDESEVLLALKKSMNCDIFARNESKDVCVTRMNRSFRPCWLPNGTFLTLADQSNILTPTLLLSRPIMVDSNNEEASVMLLDTQHENAISSSAGEDDCPLYALNCAAGSVASALSTSDEAKQAFLLLSRLFPSYHLENNAALFQDSVPLNARSNAAASKLLLNLCSLDESKAMNDKSNVDVVAQIHAAYSTGNLELACQLASAAGYTALAALMACGPACQGDVARLLHEIAQTKELNKSTYHALDRILQNVAGQCTFDNDAFRRGEKIQDWRRRLAIRIRQRPDDTLFEILNEYEASLAANEVPYPFPSYLSSSTNTKSIFYRLLQMCSDPTSMTVCEAIDPSGFTQYFHDFYLTFHLAATMTSIPDHIFHLSQYDTEYIKDGYAAQLIMQGYWERAVFVLLCSFGDSDGAITSPTMILGKRQIRWEYYSRQAKNLILRYYDTTRDPFAEERRNYLVANIGVPSYWFDEATCYRSAVVYGDLLSCIDSMFAFDIDLWRDAYVSFIVPNHILHRNDIAADKLLSTFDTAVLGAAPNSIALALFRYVEFEKLFNSYREKHRNDDAFDDDDIDPNHSESDELKALKDSAEYLYEAFTMLSASSMPSSSSSQLLPNLEFLPSVNYGTTDSSLPFSVMVSEILGNIIQWKNEISMI